MQKIKNLINHSMILMKIIKHWILQQKIAAFTEEKNEL